VPLGLSQHVTGIGITLLATSLTYFTYRILLPEVTSPPKIEPFQPFAVPVLSDIPVLGPALFNQTPLTYLAYLTVAAVAFVLLPDTGRRGGAGGWARIRRPWRRRAFRSRRYGSAR
jgi:ABC-type uncharacterized transport system permease subunit